MYQLIKRIRNLQYSNQMKSTSKKKRRSKEYSMESKFGSGDILSFVPKNEAQRVFWDAMYEKTVVLAHGCAGTGKTLLGLWFGLLEVSDRFYDKVVYVRSDVGVENQRGRGAVKGDLSEKMAPLLYPVMDNLSVITKSQGAADYLLKRGVIEPVLLEDIRGRSLNRSFILVDECQNFTREQLKTVLTRVGAESKIVLVGDTSQIDLEVFRRDNGLVDAIRRLGHLDEVGVVEFTSRDIVRNGVLANIIREYEKS